VRGSASVEAIGLAQRGETRDIVTIVGELRHRLAPIEVVVTGTQSATSETDGTGDSIMAKSSPLAEIHSSTHTLRGEGKAVHREAKPRKRGSLSYRVEAARKELATLPAKQLLIGAGIGVALLGAALSVTARRAKSAPFAGMERALTKTALVALARVVSGQTVRSVASSALIDVADALKS